MSTISDELNTKLSDLMTEVTALRTKHGDDVEAWTDGVRQRHDNLQTAIRNTDEHLTSLTKRAEQIESVRRAAEEPSNREAATQDEPTRVRTSDDDTVDRAMRVLDEAHRSAGLDDF